MGTEKTKEQLLEKAAWDTELGREHYPSARKYKVDSAFDVEDNTKFKNKEVGPGSKLIVRVYRERSVKGYMLCQVIDIEDDVSWWNSRTSFIVQVLETSNPDLNKEVGRLRSVSSYGGWWGGKNEVVDVGKENWNDYKVSSR